MPRSTIIRTSVLALALAALAGVSQADDCPAPCEPGCLKKVCRPTTDVKKIDHRVYDCASEDFCMPGGSLFGRLFGGHGCDACPAGGCERHVRTKKVLVVKIRKEEQCVNKCVVEYQLAEPSCPAPLACPASGCATPILTTVPSQVILAPSPAPAPEPLNKMPKGPAGK